MRNCFIIMPFRPELAYFYRSIKSGVQQSFQDVTVERGDDRILTTTILEKIGDYIKQADVVIADCSGRNPNVFYELGMAHALGKPVILLTSDPAEEAPADIRAFEFISYAKLTPEAFQAALDGALQNVFGNPFVALYPEALALFNKFCAAKHRNLNASSSGDFDTAMKAMNALGQRLPANDQKRAEYLVRRVLGPDPEIEVLSDLKSWLDAEYP